MPSPRPLLRRIFRQGTEKKKRVKQRDLEPRLELSGDSTGLQA